MDPYTLEIPPPPPLPQLLPLPKFLTVPIPPPPFSPILATRTPLSQQSSPGEIPKTMSHSTGDKADCNGRKWFEEHYGVKKNINGPHPFHQWFLRTTIGSHLTPGCEEGKALSCLY